jgi:hypothetical protein
MSKWILAVGAVCLTGCASVSMVGYGDGWVKTSMVSYRFVAPPVLQSSAGSSYNVKVSGMKTEQPLALRDLNSNGMQRVDDKNADLQVKIEMGKARQGKATAGKIGSKWYPGFEISVPYDISMEWQRASVGQRSNTYSNVFTFSSLHGFETREQAVGAMDTIRQLGKDGVNDKARVAALNEAHNNAGAMARGLFEDRDISMDVPVVRSAAGLDLEQAYLLMSTAEGPDDVEEAMAVYEGLGMNHTNEDGTPNDTANYGVACGIAACKLMLRDLGGAWEAAKVASTFEPDGDEADQIRRVVYQQELATGERVIPEEDRAQIDAGMEKAQQLESLLNAFAK